MKKTVSVTNNNLWLAYKGFFWFVTGGILALFFLVSFTFIFFEKLYGDKVYPGVMIYGVDFGGKTKEQVIQYFEKKNTQIQDSTFIFKNNQDIATVSAKQLQLGYDSAILGTQAYSIGRSPFQLSNFVLIFQAYLYGVRLGPAYYYNSDIFTTALTPLMQKTYKAPVDGIFTMQNNRVTAFRPSINGQMIDLAVLKQKVFSYIPYLVGNAQTQELPIAVPIKTIIPNLSSENMNTYNIVDLLGEGTSFFQHSMPERIYNVTLAATRVNGVLIAPDEEFSFDKALGDVSKFTGYQQAYVIQNGKTVLGDGGGVCQISTTFFRALLHAGLPITERHAHAYRVGYYEEGGYAPGIDATVYVPSVDLKFKNDTGNWILVQTMVNPNTLQVTIDLYGTKDNRIATITPPLLSNQAPAPDPLYQDDPTIPQGVVKQIDFAAPGVRSTFTRTVIKNGALLYNDTFISDYKPWQAIYLRGTKI